MAKRSIKKFDLLARHEKLTPVVKNQLKQMKKHLEKKLGFIDNLLKKPTLEVKKEAKKEREELI